MEIAVRIDTEWLMCIWGGGHTFGVRKITNLEKRHREWFVIDMVINSTIDMVQDGVGKDFLCTHCSSLFDWL